MGRNIIKPVKILLIEDDLTLAFFIRRKLEYQEYLVRVVDNGHTGLNEALTNKYSLFLIDIGVPEVNGLEVIKNIRSNEIKTPIIIITSKDLESNEVRSYKTGANIFHPKPINYRLLEVQIKNLLRLYSPPQIINIADLKIDTNKRIVKKILPDTKNTTQKINKTKSDIYKTINLSPKEYDLILTLIEAKGAILTRTEIQMRTFSGSREGEPGAIDTLVSRLRKKIGDQKPYSMIESIYSKGFRINPQYFEQD